ncbi:MAG: hypothetical protein L3J23_03335 [Flavobacteriaceae bacterium]|nr:hypothetical protein [Flavobacteriaceae bacterium]
MANQITSAEAAQLCDNYDARCTKYKNLISKDDNRSCLFTIKELKDYIDYVEKTGKNIDGIRIYIGAYSNNLTTVFLAPTSNGVDNTKINSLNFGNGGRPPKKKYGK